MKLNEVTFKKLYAQVIYSLKSTYNRAGSIFTNASPFGQILSVVIELFQFNTLNIQNVQKSFDMNDPMNNDEKSIRALAKIGQYNPSRGNAATGSIKLKPKVGVDLLTEIKGTTIIFKDRMRLKNKNNSFEYILDLNQDTVSYTLNNTVPVVLPVIQGVYKVINFTGDGTINQSYVVPSPIGKEIDNYKFLLYVDSELWVAKRHKFDMLPGEKAYVCYTSFSGGVDIIFGNGNEGMVPKLGSIIEFNYLVTEGQEGNLINTQLNDFKFLDMPTSFYGDEIDVTNTFDVNIDVQVNFGSNGDSASYLKSIMPYASSNFVLAGPDQYKFFLQRLGIFSMIDIYTSKRNSSVLINSIYDLAKTNIDLLNTINTTSNNSTLKQLVEHNLSEIVLLRKSLLTEGGDNLINLFLIPDIKVFYGKDIDTNYFNIDLSAFVLDDVEKTRILNYLSNEGLQIITNEIKVIDATIKKYAINVTCRIYDDTNDSNLMNEIVTTISDYMMTDLRRDRIPPSDIIRLLDGLNGIDSVTVEFISEANEDYHKEYIIKSKQFFSTNLRDPLPTEIFMSDGNTYDSEKYNGLDVILGDILIEKDELPIIRGGFTDRWNNQYSTEPGVGQFSPVNVLILPEKTKRKGL